MEISEDPSNSLHTQFRSSVRIPMVQPVYLHDLENTLWPAIREATLSALEDTPHTLTFHKLYGIIYKACGIITGETFLKRLSAFLRDYCIAMRQSFIAQTDNIIFHCVGPLSRYFRAAKVLEAPYNYAEKLLIMPKKHMSFKSYMLKKLGKHVLFHSDFQQRLMDSLKEFQPSFIQHVDPVQMKELIQGLYEVDKNLSAYNPSLFAMYIPGFVASGGYLSDKQEVEKFFQEMGSEGVPRTSANNVRKRKLTEI